MSERSPWLFHPGSVSTHWATQENIPAPVLQKSTQSLPANTESWVVLSCPADLCSSSLAHQGLTLKDQRLSSSDQHLASSQQFCNEFFTAPLNMRETDRSALVISVPKIFYQIIIVTIKLLAFAIFYMLWKKEKTWHFWESKRVWDITKRESEQVKRIVKEYKTTAVGQLVIIENQSVHFEHWTNNDTTKAACCLQSQLRLLLRKLPIAVGVFHLRIM